MKKRDNFGIYGAWILVFCGQLIQTSFYPGVLVTRTGEREIGSVSGRVGIYTIARLKYRVITYKIEDYRFAALVPGSLLPQPHWTGSEKSDPGNEVSIAISKLKT